MLHRLPKWTDGLLRSMSRGALVTFAWGPECFLERRSVEIAGSFTSWQPIGMVPPNDSSSDGQQQNRRHYWTLQHHLDPGFHEYKFVVDGKWVHDDKKTSKDDGMGGKNNVIHVEELPVKRKLLDAGELDDDDDTVSVSSGSSTDSEPEWEVLGNSPVSLANSVSSSIELVGSDDASSKAKSLEVERKFAVPPDYRDRLSSNGFKPAEQFGEVLNDSYYDFANGGDFPLLANDHWLRQRNGDWELKYPVGCGGGSSSSSSSSDGRYQVATTTLYHETSDPKDIMAKVRLIMPDLEENANLSTLLASRTLTPFAQLETRRECFKGSSSDNVNVVVDVTDWGYMIGEIEIVVETKEEVPAATLKIQQLADVLAFSKMDLTSIRDLACSSCP